MSKLTVHLDYMSASAGRDYQPNENLALPVKALDSQGAILAEGAARLGEPALLYLPAGTSQAFVRLTWPSGRTETQRVLLSNQSSAELTFSDDNISQAAWSAWAIPRLGVRTPLATAHDDVDLDLDRFQRVWLRLWRNDNGKWSQVPLRPDETYRNGAAWQIDLTLDNAAWLLHVGGSNVPWRFISLPGGGRARVLLTPKDTRDTRGDSLAIVVTSFRPAAETLLEFLARDSMRAADTLVHSAHYLFAEKFEDPVSAVAGAYYLLRRGDWQQIPLEWFQNLSRYFGWMPDTHLLYCVRLLREGTAVTSANEEPIQLLVASLSQGWPVYKEGIALLQEAASALRAEFRSLQDEIFDHIQAIASARSWTGAATSFHGRQPEMPSTVLWVGMPHAPRRRKLSPVVKAALPKREPEEHLWLDVADQIPRLESESYIAKEIVRREPGAQRLRRDGGTISIPRDVKTSSEEIQKTKPPQLRENEFLLGKILS